MSKASVLGDRRIQTSHLNPGRVKPMNPGRVKIYACRFLAKQELVGCVRIMWLSQISGHGAGGLVSQWDNTIKLPWVHTVTSRYLSLYDLRCCQDIKQKTNLATSKVISERTSACNSAKINSFLYSASLQETRALPVPPWPPTISRSFTLSWYWTSQSLTYPGNAKRLD